MQSVYCHKAFCITIGAVVAVGLASCSKSPTMSTLPAKPISVTNKERVRLDLRTIKPSWHFYRAEFGAEDWKLSTSSNMAKRVQYDQLYKAILWEEDYYYTGSTYTTINGVTDWENVVIHYDYTTNLYSLHYIGTNTSLGALAEPFWSGTKDKMKVMKAADSIMKTLKLSRL